MKNMLILIFLFASATKAQNNIFDFTIDKRLFISYAFMNAAGNDAEWRKEGMNPIRIDVRNILNAKIDSAFFNKIHKYVYDNHLESWTNYGPYALINNGPPDFNISINYKNSDLDSVSVSKVDGLREYFIEFYHDYDIEKLWKQYQPIIQEENQKYEPYANKALLDITNYCRINNDYFAQKANNISFQKIPLMLYFTAQTLKVNGKIYIITGPSDGNPSESSFYHEALHYPIGEIIKRNTDLINKYSDINSINKAELGYEDWIEFFEDCLVRTIDKRMEAKLFNESQDELLKSIYSEYKIGMILCPYLNEELEKYENINITLEEYFPKLLSNLDFNKERQRLDNFNKNGR
ncbi:MAG: hypothetical protein A2V93_09620 [Ignavibacteria bacterium RBG_16_34_14]|nr:MAG: hypothetical protein A2V93_09620 [Ignavibacteria bacterium RBG_16_34_14]